MTYYQGGKKRDGEDIAEVIHKIALKKYKPSSRSPTPRGRSASRSPTPRGRSPSRSRSPGRVRGATLKGYCEPFCGMMGVYRHIPEMFADFNVRRTSASGRGRGKTKLKYIGGDRNPNIIKMWKALQRGWVPPTKCSRTKYKKLKPLAFRPTRSVSLDTIFLGFACSYRGSFFSTYCPGNNIKHQQQAARDIGKQIKNVKLVAGGYSETVPSQLKNYVIYCDPPYRDTLNKYQIGHQHDSFFDYPRFVEWCSRMSKNNMVFVSEYSKPCKNSRLVWKKGKEKLFLIVPPRRSPKTAARSPKLSTMKPKRKRSKEVLYPKRIFYPKRST